MPDACDAPGGATQADFFAADLRAVVLRVALRADVLRAPPFFAAARLVPARFAVDDAVLARNIHPTGHTRLPRYVRGKRGRIVRVDGVFVFPDTNAYGAGENPTWLYTVAFTARELWGESGDPGGVVTVAAFEPYLDPA